MGSFDANCCLTGLPIHHYDKVRAGIITHNPHRDGYFGSPAAAWQFLTPPIASSYDDYGNIEFDEIDDVERDVLDLFLKMWLPGLEPDEKYPDRKFQSSKDEWDLKKLWDGCFYHQLQYDPNRWRRQKTQEWYRAGCPEDVKPWIWFRTDRYPVHGEDCHTVTAWMCHDWAWDVLLNMGEISEIRSMT